ncbi:patatin-like phospholipase family protein [Leadbetterella byssophila]|uniref:patatin-like phospholipase family protein n=1 Tax=Leadbetterella byssophila TaxID=316068 RepID=UPI0039A1746E
MIHRTKILPINGFKQEGYDKIWIKILSLRLMIRDRKISLVLGSGGARGLAHIGAIRAIEEQGGIIDEIVGSSIGALIGGIYAKGDLSIFEDWVTKLTNRDVLSLLDFTWQSTGVVKGQKILNTVKQLIPDAQIEDLPIPFAAVTTNLTKECDCCLESGSLYEAIRASISIPGVFTAVLQDEDKMVDGGVLNPLPLKYLKKRKENLVIAVNLEAPAEKREQIFRDNSMIAVLQHAYYVMRNQITQLTLDLYTPDYVVQIPRDISGIWDYDKAKFLIERGKELTYSALQVTPNSSCSSNLLK